MTSTTGKGPRAIKPVAPGCLGRIGAWCYDHRRRVLIGGTAHVLARPDSDSRQGFAVPVHIRAGTAGTPIKVELNPVQTSVRHPL